MNESVWNEKKHACIFKTCGKHFLIFVGFINDQEAELRPSANLWSLIGSLVDWKTKKIANMKNVTCLSHQNINDGSALSSIQDAQPNNQPKAIIGWRTISMVNDY